jgi:hypothetical protein
VLARPNAMGVQISSPKEKPIRKTKRKRGARLRNRNSFSMSAASGSRSTALGN